MKALMLSEILETKKSCFERDCNEQLHDFGEICKKYVFVTKIDKYVAKICNHWLYESYVEFFTVPEMLPTSAPLQFLGMLISKKTFDSLEMSKKTMFPFPLENLMT